MTDEEYREAVREMEKLLDHPFPLPEDDARLLELSERIHRYEAARWHQGEGKQAPPPPPRRREV